MRGRRPRGFRLDDGEYWCPDCEDVRRPATGYVLRMVSRSGQTGMTQGRTWYVQPVGNW